jgi:glycosyltransferase involved in cell wall biosynthesis
MNKDYKISVITPSFNSGDQIERAIKSVIDQSYKNFEHIIVDGVSTDNTIEILKKYPHLKWVSEKDSGQTNAMNKGFKLSTGEIIVYLNADDYFLPGAFTEVIKHFNKGAQFVVGNVLIKSPRLGTEFINNPRVTFEGMLRHWEPNAFCHNPVGYFYKREIQEEFPFNESNDAKQDLEFLLDCSSKYRFTKINYTLGVFEDQSNTKTGKDQAKLDYWQSSSFPFLQKYIETLSLDKQIEYIIEQQIGYAQLQEHHNRLNASKFKILPAKELPLLSVIIPTYNCEKYICRAIDSVLNQGLVNFEIIVVDDCSTDNTQEILKASYKTNKHIKVITHSENLNLGASRNTGIDKSRGKYIFFLDSDDWIEKGSLVHMLNISDQYNADVVASGIKKVFENGGRVDFFNHSFGTSGGEEALSHYADFRIASVAWSKIYKADLIKANSIKFITPHYHEDIIFTTQILSKCKKYISISDSYYNYFQRENSIVSAKPGLLHLRSYIRIYLDMVKFIEKSKLNKTEYGESLANRLLRAHCTLDVHSKLLRYISTRTKEEWEEECKEALSLELGVKGMAIADFLLYITDKDNNSYDHYQMDTLNLELSSIKSSLGWRLTLKIRSIIERILPTSSLRRKIFLKFLSLFRKFSK